MWKHSPHRFDGHSRHRTRRGSEGSCSARPEDMQKQSIVTYLLGLLLGSSVTLALCTGCYTTQLLDSPMIVAVPADEWDADDFQTLVTALGMDCPLNANAVMQVLPIEGYLGLTWWDSEVGKYRIQIEAAQTMRAIQDSLIHEWAHAMVWDATQRSEDQGHGPMWGVAYARAYRTLERVIAPDGDPEAPDSMLVSPDDELEAEGSYPCFRLRGRVGVQLPE